MAITNMHFQGYLHFGSNKKTTRVFSTGDVHKQTTQIWIHFMFTRFSLLAFSSLQRKLIVADVCALQMQQLGLSSDSFVVAPSLNISVMRQCRLIYCECVALRIVLNFRLSENEFWPKKVEKLPIVRSSKSSVRPTAEKASGWHSVWPDAHA